MADQLDKKQINEIPAEEKSSPKEDLENLSDNLLTVGIAIIIFLLIIGLANLIGGDIYDAVSFIGTLLIKYIGPPLIILVPFIGALLARLGILIKDEDEQDLYLGLVYLLWFIDLIVTPLLGLGYIVRVISGSFIVGFGFLLFIAPLIIFEFLKGLQFLLSKFSR
jgi:hypothetical protein